jgi:hypothetical protein
MVIVEGPNAPFVRPVVTAPAHAQWNGPNQLIVVVEAPSDLDGVVLVHEMFDRGWTAKVGGTPIEVRRANGLFMAVSVSSGRHKIVLTYAPASVRIGRWASGGAFLFWLAFAVVRFGKGEPLPSDRAAPSLLWTAIVFIGLFVLSAAVFQSRWSDAFPIFLGGR